MNKEKNKTKEEILDGLNIITPLNELEGQEIYSREEVLAAMEEYAQQFQSKENEGKQAGVKELKEIREAFQWTWDNMDKAHTSDHFNIPANGIQRLDNLISELPTIESGEGRRAGVEDALYYFREGYKYYRGIAGNKSIYDDAAEKVVVKAFNELPNPPITIQSGERGEVERLKGEIEFLESEIGRLGGFIYKPK